MEVKINQVLGLNKLQYINLVDKQFNQWCEVLSNTYYVPMREFQKNVKLYNWFLKQWESRIVEAFLNENQGLILDGIKAPDIYQDLFMEIIESPEGLNRIYPGIIVKKIKSEHYKTLTNK